MRNIKRYPTAAIGRSSRVESLYRRNGRPCRETTPHVLFPLALNRQVRLSFAGTPPPLPTIRGLLQAFRTERDLRVICVHYNHATEQALKALSPVTLELSTVNLEDALISYLGNHGEKAFILTERETNL